MKKFTKQEILELYGQVTLGEISFSQMVEIMNERMSEAANIYEEPKKGDLAIFWQFDKTQAVVRLFDNEQGDIFRTPFYVDNTGHWWANAIKFESKEQYERFIKGER